MGFFEACTLLLIAAKLFGFAHYGWVVAFAPMLVGYGVMLLILVVAAIIHNL